MAKLKNPLLSLAASGTINKTLTFLKRHGRPIVEKTPKPYDAQSAPQLGWRHMYQKAVALWHALSVAEKQEWESAARPKHMTGFAWFMSQCLRPNPGIYLPLQGGTMSGDIDMADHLITGLPTPTLDPHAAPKGYVDSELETHLETLNAHIQDLYERYRTNVNIVSSVTAYYSTGAALANALYAYPLIVHRDMTIDRLIIRVIALSAGHSARLGIYNDGVNLFPGTLLLDAGEVSVATTGLKSIAINQPLTKGIYNLAIFSEGTPTLHMHQMAAGLIGVDGSLEKIGMFRKDQAYGALPDSFPATGARTPLKVFTIGIRILSYD